jgi:uncharacterized lipoprotein YddW (UPF0748 family)
MNKRRDVLTALLAVAATQITVKGSLGGTAPPNLAEIRAVWLDRSSLVTREEIRSTLEQLALANFNLVLVNVWSRGYPLWPSNVYAKETSLSIDPGFLGRDPLAELIEESARFGLVVMPWFEYGFIGGYSGYYPGVAGQGPLFDRHPEWLARTRAGLTGFTAPGGLFYWMSQTNPEVRQFLIRLVEEVAQSYQIVGIQFDRARYPQLDCGYDEHTLTLYRQMSGQKGLPEPGDPQWMRWRADQINLFILELRQRVRGVSARHLVSNAPIVYPYSYVNFLQEYPVWIAQGGVDLVMPQIYRRDSVQFEAELNRQLATVASLDGVVPGIDSTNPTVDELIRMVEIVRSRRLPGVALWYYRSLLNKGALQALRQTVFSQKATLPTILPGRSLPASMNRLPRPDGRRTEARP